MTQEGVTRENNRLKRGDHWPLAYEAEIYFEPKNSPEIVQPISVALHSTNLYHPKYIRPSFHRSQDNISQICPSCGTAPKISTRVLMVRELRGSKF